MNRDVVIVGAGHNGLIAACYLARAGRDVLVLEALDRPGGGSRTEEVIPGYRFDLHSAAHNIINMTSIPAELQLRDAGLRYLEMDPFSVAVHEDGRRVRFWRSVEATVESIAEHDSAEARAYRALHGHRLSSRGRGDAGDSRQDAAWGHAQTTDRRGARSPARSDGGHP